MLNKLFYNESKWSIKVVECNIENHIFAESHLTEKHVKDVKAEFIADPFMIKEKNMWYLFYEIYDKKSKKGIIGYSKSLDTQNWEYGGVVLEEKVHLSYPYVFKFKNEIYMIPESGAGDEINLYKASNFPNKWDKVSTLIKGRYFDSSIFYHENIWYLLTLGTKPEKFTLCLFYSENLEGPWREHPKSPLIVNDPKITRPGGRVVNHKGNLYRFTQDCEGNYGKSVSAFKILKINTEEYEEEFTRFIFGNSNQKKDWNEVGMHNIDIHELDKNRMLVACDGYYFKRKNKIISKISDLFNK